MIAGAQEVHGNRLTLSQLARAHRNGLPRQIGGEFEITLRDARDPRIILEQIKQKNIITRYARQSVSGLFGWMQPTTTVIGFCEESNPANEMLGSIKSKLILTPTTILQTPTPSKAGLTWTYAASYAAPSADRTFQTVFLGYHFTEAYGTTSSGTTTWWSVQAIQAYTVLTAPRTQTTLSLLDITYRITFAE